MYQQQGYKGTQNYHGRYFEYNTGIGNNKTDPAGEIFGRISENIV